MRKRGNPLSQMNTSPEYLYMYRPFNKDSKEILADRELYFPAPGDFNDPFDCKALSLKGATNKDLKIFCKKVYDERYKYYFPLECKKELDDLLQRIDKLGSPDEFKGNIDAMIRDNSDRQHGLGILCLSKEKMDIRMWSYYADKHKGFCLVFYRPLLERFTWSFGGYCTPIDYTGRYPSLKEYNKAAIGIDHFILLRKAKFWQHENEWRVIVDPLHRTDNPANRRKYSFLDWESMIESVIVGCEMPDKDISKIKRLLNGWSTPPKLYRMNKSDFQHAFEDDLEELK